MAAMKMRQFSRKFRGMGVLAESLKEFRKLYFLIFGLVSVWREKFAVCL
jgi:hypothetical protein